MIVIFHLFANLFYNLCKKRINARNSSWSNFTLTKLNVDKSPLAQRDAENDIKFDPPMYKQRYQRAVELLLHEKWKDQLAKVVDFGCGEFGLFVFLKNIIPAKEIVFIDIDEFLLSDYLYKVYPLNADYLTKRHNPLTVNVFAGSVAYPDENLLNTDAIVSIEVIEHLYPDTLEAFPYNFFSYIVPKVVVITTPNADFNVLFGNADRFRHPDHKFEWTREQFQSWATNITLRFPRYTVQFDGIGLGPDGYEDCGHCSQLAVFIRKDIICDKEVEITPCICKTSTCRSNSKDGLCCLCQCQKCLPKYSFGICTYNCKDIFKVRDQGEEFKLIKNIVYPVDIDMRTAEEKILDELKYRIHLCGTANELYYSYERDRIEIPLERLVYVTSGPFPSEPEVKSILLKHNYQIEECMSQETKQVETCVIYEMENDASGSDTDASGYESDKYDTDDGHLSDWDDKDVATWNDPANKDKKCVSHKGVKAQLHLEVSGNRRHQGALFDSGYQKSPSVPDESPQSMSTASKDAIPLDFKNLNEKPNKLSNILSVFDNFDKINELDALHKDKKYFNFSSNLPHKEVMKKLCQEIAKHPVPGPSRDHRKSKHPKKATSSDSDESVDDVKSITTCILENSLNKIEFQDEELPKADLIQELIEQPPPQEHPIQQIEPVEPVALVENGDLANNNRDLEGNNYPAENVDNPEPENDNAIDNLDHNNVNVDNNNEIAEAVAEEHVEERVDENVEPDPPENIEVAWSSREALFDANSQVDLLEEFEVGAVATVNTLVFPSNCLVVADDNSGANEAVLPPEESGFPNWLLQIFEEGEVPEDDLHDEPHFYCQGDGLGVHPSTIAINDDADDEGNESGSSDDSSESSSSSSSGSADFANAENHSIPNLVAPDDSRHDNLVVVGQAVAHTDQSSNVELPEEEETFENAEGSGS